MSIIDPQETAREYCEQYIVLVQQLDTGEIDTTSPEVQGILSNLEVFLYSVRSNAEERNRQQQLQEEARRVVDAILADETLFTEEVDRKVADIKRELEEQIAELEEKIKELQRIIEDLLNQEQRKLG